MKSTDIESRGSKTTTLGNDTDDTGLHGIITKRTRPNAITPTRDVDTFNILWCFDIEEKEFSETDTWVTIAIYTVFIIFVIVVSCTVSLSFWYINYSQYALEKNTYTGVRLADTKEEGRYFLPLTEQMVVFPATFNEVSFVSESFADNGLEFNIHISFFYKLPKNNIGKIYDQFSTNYHTRVVSNSKRLVKNEAAQFPVDYYLENRSYIEDTIATALEIDLMDTVYVDAPAFYFKITRIEFPASLIATSLNTAKSLQQNEVEEYLQDIDVINADTNALKAAIDANAVQTIEFANNEAVRILTTSKAQADRILLITRSNGLEHVCFNLKITTPSLKMKLVEAFAIKDNTHDPKILNDLGSGVLVGS